MWNLKRILLSETSQSDTATHCKSPIKRHSRKGNQVVKSSTVAKDLWGGRDRQVRTQEIFRTVKLLCIIL